jgi:hypothetical protein
MHNTLDSITLHHTNFIAMLYNGVLVVWASLALSITAINTQLVGTWSTKSAKVLTGPVRHTPAISMP